MNLKTLLSQIRTRFTEAGIHNPVLEARWMLKAALGLDDSELITGDKILSADELRKIESLAARRAAGEPLSRILGEREFRGHTFKIGPGILDPRPDTETLVELALQRFHVEQAFNILDLGTGSGCIVLSILKERPLARGVGVELAPDALSVIMENARNLGVTERFSLVHGSWADGIEGGGFDLVVSNPPYIRTSVIPNLDVEVRNHDPILALDGGEDGLEAYKKIFSELPRLLKPGGRALLEIGFDQQDDLMRLSKDSRIRIERTHTDSAGLPRVVEITCGDK